MSAHFIANQACGASDARVAVEPQSAISPGWAHLARSPGGASHEFTLLTERVLPDPAICQAKPAGFGNYVDCLVEQPFQCLHALGLGNEFLCRHPQRHEIIMRTSTPNH